MHSHSITCTEAQTTILAQRLSVALLAGDCILLSGEVGAGKTHFARQIILKRLAVIDQTEDVPSPTFTLVQTYDLGIIEIWHADLYRLSDANEAFELGLEDAFETQISLVEWPDRLGTSAPKNALSIYFDASDDKSRVINFQWSDKKWDTKTQAMLQDNNET